METAATHLGAGVECVQNFFYPNRKYSYCLTTLGDGFQNRSIRISLELAEPF